MDFFLSRMKLAFFDTYSFLNTLRFKYWFSFFLSFVFLGWNGLQILFSLNLLISFVNTRSVTRLVYTTLEFHSRSIPIYFFIIVSIVIVHWLIRSVFEAGFTGYLLKMKHKPAALISIGINFFVPNLIIILTLFFLVLSFFMFFIFLQILLSGYSATVVFGLESTIYRLLGFTLFLAIAITMWLTDFVLPLMTRGYSFKNSLTRSIIILNRRPFSLIAFYLLKFSLILLSVFIFRMVLRHLLLPFFIMLETQFSFGIFLFSGRELIIQNLFINIRTILIVFLSALIVYTPILAPFYLYQRFLLLRYARV